LREGADAKLWVRFEAELTGSMAGYYKSEGDAGEDGKKPVYVRSNQKGIQLISRYALTQFEATAARKAFP
jgi:aminopeptidase 2